MPSGELFQFPPNGEEYYSMSPTRPSRSQKRCQFCINVLLYSYLLAFSISILYLVHLMSEQTTKLYDIMNHIEKSTLNQTSCVLGQVCQTIGKEVCGMCF